MHLPEQGRNRPTRQAAGARPQAGGRVGRRRPPWGSAARSEDSLLTGRAGAPRPLCRAPLLPPDLSFLASLSAPPEAASPWAGQGLPCLPTGPFRDKETEAWWGRTVC